ncbi:carboxypeptidase regulatory-like domain-containing protein [Gemmatimonadota bacterium]
MMNPRAASLAFLLVVLSLGAPGPGPIPSLAAQARGEGSEIRGQVMGRRGRTLTPLPYALIQVHQGRRLLSAVSDSAGRYRFPGLAEGRWRLQALHVGYDGLSAEVLVPEAGWVTLDVELPWKPVELPPVNVVASPLPPVWQEGLPPPFEMAEVALRTLETGTGMVEAGLAAVVQGIPGQDPADPRDVLLMRGSAADMKLVLLDGAPVYTPFHMGGLVESLDPWALGGASLFLGGAPARFDGGLSYIMDLRTRTPRRDRIRGRASLDFLSGGATLEGPLLGGGVLLSSRALHDLGAPILGRGPSPYGYGDVLGRAEWEVGNHARVFVTGFWNREEVDLDLSGNRGSLGPAPEAAAPEVSLGALLPDGHARWGNRALVTGTEVEIDGTLLELRFAASEYEARLPLGDSVPFFAHGTSGRLRGTLDFSRPFRSGALRFGASLDRLNSRYQALELDPNSSIPDAEMASEGITGGVYLEATRPLSQDLQLRAGLRADHFSEASGLRLAPRIAVTWLLTDAAALTLAAGRYHQYSTLPIEELRDAFDEEAGGVADPSSGLALGVGASNHLLVALDQLLAPGLRLGLEGFVKEFQGVTGAAGNSLKASGVDLRVARQGERASGWLGYTLTWFWSSSGDILGGGSRFSGRHLLSAGLTTRLTDRTGLLLRVGYGDGLPYTSIPLFNDAAPQAGADREKELNTDLVLNDAPGFSASPDQGFLRVDAELFGTFSPHWLGQNMELRPYIRVLNALNRRDALFYHFDRWRDQGPRPLADLPLVPLIGVEWRF